ncbi:MAG: RNA polymerase sigma factor [Vicinamibacterales bacterium]
MTAKSATPAQSQSDPPASGDLPLLETDRPQPSADPDPTETRDYQQLFVNELGTIRSVVSYVARRHRLAAQESEEFASHVYLKLIEDDYIVFRKFQGRSSLRTYLTVIIQRLFLDRRIAQWGKWRPSSFARRHGETAMLLERLTTYRGLSFDDACETMKTEHGVTIARTELEAIYLELPVRPRRLFVTDDVLDDAPAPATDPARGLTAEENTVVAARTSQILAAELARLAPDDQELLKSRFRDGLSVADIARSTGQDSKVLYRRLKRLLQELRASLEARGVEGSAVLELAGSDFEIGVEWDGS